VARSAWRWRSPWGAANQDVHGVSSRAYNV
jgi:hypothetical protein